MKSFFPLMSTHLTNLEVQTKNPQIHYMLVCYSFICAYTKSANNCIIQQPCLHLSDVWRVLPHVCYFYRNMQVLDNVHNQMIILKYAYWEKMHTKKNN